ncbi:murein hydrolase activator EnvC family protein [Microbacterium sp. I2]|uniref:murein hydrolase activator EnvC family protein n=1 Tax=Microbacterium sp. I2 TaxID=3391826 RepID=UPI003ED9DC7D
MRPHRPSGIRPRRIVVTLALTALLVVVTPAASGLAAPAPVATEAPVANGRWIWPLAGYRLERAFVAPPHRYGPGHRGIDLRAVGGRDVRAPAAGTIAFAGQVAGRPVLTIDHGDGLVTTLEPIDSVLVPGTAVAASEFVGTIGAGGHASAGSLHFGVRLHGEYINPMLLLGGVPRAILLPCC